MEVVDLPHLQPEHRLHIALFADVKNSAFLRTQLLEGNAEFEYAFLDASLLLSRNHLLAACFRAVNDSVAGRLKTRNVHSEIVFALSPNNNIAESFRRFGISDESTHIVAIKVGGVARDIESHLKAHVEGQMLPLTDAAVAQVHDLARIRKIYKLVVPKGSRDEVGDDAEAWIIGSMALKGS